MSMPRMSGAGAFVLAALLVLTACSSGAGDGAATSTTAPAAATTGQQGTVRVSSSTSLVGGGAAGSTTSKPASTSTSAPAPTTTAAAVGSTTTAALPTVALDGFTSPTGNIGCRMLGGVARCDVRSRTWTPPPKPATCQSDWAQGLQVSAQGAGFVCAGDTALGATAVLAYGTRSVVGDVACTSAETGMTCVHTPSGHGFSVNRDEYRIF